MVWMNNEHHNAKSYPPEARGGAICNCVRCTKSRRDMARINKERVRLRDELIRLTDEMVGGPWQDGIANG
jgi:hypothetical protein